MRADRGRLVAPLLLVGSAAASLGATISSAPDFVDLHVYVLGGSALDRPETLYSFVYADQSPDEPLPFVYPPFAAMVFRPLTLLPFDVAGLLWQVAILVAMYGIVRISQHLVGGGSQRAAMLWTAGLIWLEPVRIAFDLGQVGVFLTLAVLYAVYSSRWWVSGLLIGLAAGMKLTPAISGLYFVGVRRWAAVVFSAVVFFATVGLSYVVVGDQVRHYFTRVMDDTGVNRSASRSTSAGGAGSPGSWATTPVRVCWCSRRSPGRRCWHCWRGAGWASAPRIATGWARCSSSSCSACWCHRSRGFTTGSGWCR